MRPPRLGVAPLVEVAFVLAPRKLLLDYITLFSLFNLAALSYHCHAKNEQDYSGTNAVRLPAPLQ